MEGVDKLSILLEVNDLRTSFNTETGVINAVNGVSFSVEREKTLGVVGESGCGKSVMSLSIMQLIRHPGKIESGEIFFHRKGSSVDLTKMEPMGDEMRSIRGNEIAMIFQEPMTSLNPVFSIENQLTESIRVHQRLKQNDAHDKAVEMLRAVGISSPEARIKEYPHHLSGGMRQRVMIAMALSCNPALLIADEPTTALDVTIQAQVLKLMNDLRADFQASILFITHDLGVIAHMADDVIIMYLGQIVEKGSVEDILLNPKHPYTIGLMNSIPSMTSKKTDRLIPIEGIVPQVPSFQGCEFETRCPQKMEVCRHRVPTLEEIASNHYVACWHHSSLKIE